MNLKQKNILVVLVVLMVSALACSLGTSTPAAPPRDAVATSVAGTVQAMVSPTVKQAPATPAAAESESKPTSNAPAPASNTAVPPSILQVAYTDSGRNLWAWSEGGSPRQLTHSGDVEDVHISSDGSLIAFTRLKDNNQYSLWVIQNDGGGERSLIGSSDFNSMPSDPNGSGVAPAQVQWLAGSHLLLFNTRLQFEGFGFALNDDLWQVNAESGERRNLLPRGQGGSFYVSPDGKQIAIVTPQDISLVNIDGTNRRSSVLKYPHVATYSEYAYYAEPRWAKDTASLRVAIPPKAALEKPAQPTTLWNIPSDGSPAVQIGSIVTAPLIWARISPDLQKVLYLSIVGDPAQNQRQVHIAGVDGSVSNGYQTGQFTINGWAPDSERFVYTDHIGRVTYISKAGAAGVPLVEGKQIEQFKWLVAVGNSTAGSRYVTLMNVPSGWELRLGSAGGSSTLIASGGQGDGFPVFDANLADLNGTLEK